MFIGCSTRLYIRLALGEATAAIEQNDNLRWSSGVHGERYGGGDRLIAPDLSGL